MQCDTDLQLNSRRYALSLAPDDALAHLQRRCTHVQAATSQMPYGSSGSVCSHQSSSALTP